MLFLLGVVSLTFVPVHCIPAENNTEPKTPTFNQSDDFNFSNELGKYYNCSGNRNCTIIERYSEPCYVYECRYFFRPCKISFYVLLIFVTVSVIGETPAALPIRSRLVMTAVLLRATSSQRHRRRRRPRRHLPHLLHRRRQLQHPRPTHLVLS